MIRFIEQVLTQVIRVLFLTLLVYGGAAVIGLIKIGIVALDSGSGRLVPSLFAAVIALWALVFFKEMFDDQEED